LSDPENDFTNFLQNVSNHLPFPEVLNFQQRGCEEIKCRDI